MITLYYENTGARREVALSPSLRLDDLLKRPFYAFFRGASVSGDQPLAELEGLEDGALVCYCDHQGLPPDTGPILDGARDRSRRGA